MLDLFGKHWGLQAYVLRALNNKNTLAEVSQIFENTIMQKKPPKSKPHTQNHVSSYLINLNHTVSYVKRNPISLSNCCDNYSLILKEQERSNSLLHHIKVILEKKKKNRLSMWESELVYLSVYGECFLIYFQRIKIPISMHLNKRKY